MPDAHYTDPRMVALYDTLCAARDDTLFYAALAGPTPLDILDIGCGTGQLTEELIARGHRVTGLDPARPMLAVASARPGGDVARWVTADARRLPFAATSFDLAVITGHAFQVFLTEPDIAGVLGEARRVIRAGGRLAFESRNPAARAWERWNPDDSRVVVQSAEGPVEEWHRVTGVALPYVSFESLHRFLDSGDLLISKSTLNFPTEPELAAHLTAAGFANTTWLGDWDSSPLAPTSPEFIVIAT